MVTKAEAEVASLIIETQERRNLLSKATLYDLDLPKKGSVEEWRSLIEKEGKRKYILAKNELLLQRHGLDKSKSSLPYEENLLLWFSRLGRLTVGQG